jgi:hypothetical protein
MELSQERQASTPATSSNRWGEVYERLTPRQKHVLPFVLRYPSISAQARAAGVDRHIVSHWYNHDPAWREAVALLRNDRLQETLTAVALDLEDAFVVYHNNLASKDPEIAMRAADRLWRIAEEWLRDAGPKGARFNFAAQGENVVNVVNVEGGDAVGFIEELRNAGLSLGDIREIIAQIRRFRSGQGGQLVDGGGDGGKKEAGGNRLRRLL